MMRILFISLLAGLLFSHSGVAQNLFDEEHTKQFADYLYKSSQFKLATEEYERWLFMNPANETAKLYLLKSYRKAGLFDKGIIRTKELFPDVNTLPENIFDEYTYMLVSDRKFNEANKLITDVPTLPEEKKDYLHMNISLLNKDWKDARQLYQHNNNDSLQSFMPYGPIIKEADDLRHRSAGLATMFSTVVPGTGKFYTGEWKDGIVSLVLVGACAFQSYRGFHRDGVSSAYGWIYGSISTGFYLGNIYGSFKSAKKFNKKYEDALVKKSRDLFMVNQ